MTKEQKDHLELVFEIAIDKFSDAVSDNWDYDLFIPEEKQDTPEFYDVYEDMWEYINNLLLDRVSPLVKQQ